MSDKQIFLKDPDTIVLKSPYNAQEVAATKRISGARWDKLQRVWTFPTTSLAQLREFAERFDYLLSDELSGFDLPSHPVGTDRVEISNGKIELWFPYDQVKIKAVRSIVGATWNKTCWEVPFGSVAQVLAYADQFGLEMSEAVKDTLEGMVSEQEEESAYREELSRAEEADYEPDDIALELFPYQKAAVAYAMRAKKVFIADQVGLGKTPEAIASIETAKAYPAVVSCPPSLVLNWKKEIERFAPQRKVAVVKGRKEFPEDEHDFLVIGDANLDHWKTKLKGYKGYVFDESHRFKNFEAKRTKAAILIAKQAEMVLLLTGTPITNRPAEYAAQLKVLGRLSDFGGKWPFYKRYANAFRDNFGQWNIQGASHLEELNRKLRGTCYIRRTKDQVLDELPEIRRSFLYVEPSAKVMKEYRKAEADIASFLAMRAAEIAREIGQSPQSAAVRARIKAEAAEHLVRLSTLRRLAALAKIEAVEEWAKERVENEEKVVLAAHHRAVVDAFADAFGAAKIQGGMKAEEVEAGKEDFQERDQMVMVLSIQAGGTGHTLTAAKELGIVELPWTPADVEQTEGRVHRKGQTRGVLITTFVAEGTIDEQMVELLDEKRAIVEASIEGETTQQLSIAGDLLLSFLP